MPRRWPQYSGPNLRTSKRWRRWTWGRSGAGGDLKHYRTQGQKKCWLSLYLGSYTWVKSVGSCWCLHQMAQPEWPAPIISASCRAPKWNWSPGYSPSASPKRVGQTSWEDLPWLRSNFVKASVLKRTQDVKRSFICYWWGRNKQDAVTFSFATGWTSSSTKWPFSTWEARQNV